ncbi:uncharacterized protein LOC126835741 [Adelges cooleyi]|uniref:uncharacterized protein LOC126835741 n=1 Tax=Adelges cooleyi TaxID=133065 RepID=UPI0021805CC4|nr:uncharacterized protein LOC126835741 [Adelges cooleyi]
MSKYLCLASLLLAVAIVNSLDNPFLSSKTRYCDVGGEIRLKDGYEVTRVLLYVRHASSSLSDKKKNRELMTRKQDKIRENIKKRQINNPQLEVPDHIRRFLEWNPNSLPGLETGLLPVGKQELKDLASRLSTKLSGIFGDQDYDAKKFPILSMPATEDDDRNVQSARVFLNALFKGGVPDEIPTCADDDLLLMMEYAKTKDPKLEEHKAKFEKKQEEYKNGDDIKSMSTRFSDKLWLDTKDVDYSCLKGTWECCREARIITQDNDATPCHLFEEKDAEVMLILDEMFWWWFTSVSESDFNGKMACGVAEHLLLFLKSEIPINPMYFLNRSNIAMIHQALGLHPKEEKLFTTSHIMPYMANFLAVVLEKAGSEKLVAFFFSENLKTIELDDGTQCEFCSLPKVIKKLEKYLKTHGCQDLKCEEWKSGDPRPENFKNDKPFYSIPKDWGFIDGPHN